MAGNSNSVKVFDENGGPVAHIEEKEDEREDSLAHRLNLFCPLLVTPADKDGHNDVLRHAALEETLPDEDWD